MPEKLLLGQILVEEGVLTKEELHQALLEQKKSNKRLGRILVDLGFLSEEIIIDHLTHQITDILEECEDITSHLVRKSHELIREKPIIYKKTPFNPYLSEYTLSHSRYLLRSSSPKNISSLLLPRWVTW
ncbi:MAG: hypothetical protein AB1422_03795 [bacterium]